MPQSQVRIGVGQVRNPMLAEGAIHGQSAQIEVDRFGHVKLTGPVVEELVPFISEAAFSTDPFDWARTLPQRVPRLSWRYITECGGKAAPVGPTFAPSFPAGTIREIPDRVAAPGREFLLTFCERTNTELVIHIAADGRVLGAEGYGNRFSETITVDGVDVRFGDDPERWARGEASRMSGDFYTRLDIVGRTHIPAPGFDIAADTLAGSIGVTASGDVVLIGDIECLARPLVTPQGAVSFAQDPLMWLRRQPNAPWVTIFPLAEPH